MVAKIQIPDGLPLNKVLKGSLYLTAHAEGSFRKYNISDKKSQKKCFKKLSHGKVSWTKDEVRLNIHVDRSEHDVDPNAIISADAGVAAAEAFDIFDDEED